MILYKRLFFAGIALAQMFLLASFSTAQTRVWTRLCGTSGADIGGGVAVDAAGNMYVTGVAEGALDGQTYVGGSDICLIKYDSSGTKQWTRLSGTTDYNRGEDVAVDAAGNVYICGYTRGALDGQPNAGEYDICLVKYDNNGTKLWTRLSGSAGNDYGNRVAADAFGNVYVAGVADSGFDGQPFAGNTDICLLKYDSSGTKLWTRLCGTTASMGGYGNDGGDGVAVDGGGHIYVTGSVSDTLDDQPNAGREDICLLKYDSSGTKLWTRLCGTDQTDVGEGVAVDTCGNVYVSGCTYGALDGQTLAGYCDICLLKYNSSGTKLWTRLCGTANAEFGIDVNTDGGGYVYVTGRAEGALDGQSYAGSGDICLIKYNSGGTRLWTRLCGTSGWDQGQGVAVDGGGNIFVSGFCSGSFDGQTFAGGYYDIFLVKYGITPLTISSILPDTEGVANSPVHIRAITGTGFLLNTSVRLSRTGKTDITATNVTVSGVWTTIACDFSLAIDDTGTWDVVVDNEDGRADTLPQAFTVFSEVLPLTPQLSYPLNNVIRQIFTLRFGWYRSKWATTYECQIATDSSFTTITKDTIGLTDTTVILTTPRYDLCRFYWRVRAVNGSGASAWSAVRSYTTGPFSDVKKKNPLTAVSPFDFSVSDRVIRYALGRTTDVSIRIFDLNGRMIVPIINRTQSAGEYSVSFADNKLSTGLYLLRFRAGSFEKTQNIAIVR